MLTQMSEDAKEVIGFKDLKDRNVLVVGLGKSGISAARLLRYAGARVYAVDRSNKVDSPEWVHVLPYDTDVDHISLVVLSPGVPWSEPPVQKALSKGIEVIGEIELSYRALSEYPVQWIAITGTNGKSTTTTLIDLMLKKDGFRVLTGGNIGEAIGDVVVDAIKSGDINNVDYVVVEVSSFQLESISQFRAHIAVVLNITEDHMDRYSAMDDYIAAKRMICKSQTGGDFIVLNYDDTLVRDFGNYTQATPYYFSIRQKVQGGYLLDGRLMLEIDDVAEFLLYIEEVALWGMHNIENALAASVACRLAGCSLSAMVSVLREFKGLEHRMEIVAEHNEVLYINDSKGTNISATLKSVEGLKGAVVLILGGRDKGGDFGLLKEYKDKVKAIVAIGEAKEKIYSELAGIFRIEKAVNMEEAVLRATSLAEPGDTVLLSPGCASFDMFRNFEHRGEVFKNAVRRLCEK